MLVFFLLYFIFEIILMIRKRVIMNYVLNDKKLFCSFLYCFNKDEKVRILAKSAFENKVNLNTFISFKKFLM